MNNKYIGLGLNLILAMLCMVPYCLLFVLCGSCQKSEEELESEKVKKKEEAMADDEVEYLLGVRGLYSSTLLPSHNSA